MVEDNKNPAKPVVQSEDKNPATPVVQTEEEDVQLKELRRAALAHCDLEEEDVQLKESRRVVLAPCGLEEEDIRLKESLAEEEYKNLEHDISIGVSVEQLEKVCKEEELLQKDVFTGTAAVKQDAPARRVATIKDVLAEEDIQLKESLAEEEYKNLKHDISTGFSVADDALLKESRVSLLSRCGLLLDSEDDPGHKTHCSDTTSKEVCKEEDVSTGTAAVTQDASAKRVATIKDVLAETEGLVAGIRPVVGESADSLKRYWMPTTEATSEVDALPLNIGVAKSPSLPEEAEQLEGTSQPPSSNHTTATLAHSNNSRPGAFFYPGTASTELLQDTPEEIEEDIDRVTNQDDNESLSDSGGPLDDCRRLSVALEVTEASNLPEAQEVDLEEAAEKRRVAITRRLELRRNLTWVGAVCLLFLLAVIVIGVLAVVDLPADQETKPTSSETLPDHEPTRSPEEHLLSLLPVDTQDDIHQDEESPQTKAYEWILQDPNLEDLSDGRVLQRFALATLFYSTNGASGEWFSDDNWIAHNVHECEWYNYNTHGFYAIPEIEEDRFYNVTNATAPCGGNGVYEHLWLVNNGLEGTLPEELYLLTSLKSISLDRNQLQGTLSTRIGGLANLEALALFTNEMTGSLPTQLGLLTNLEYLWLMSNAWTGSIPTELGMLSDSLVYLLVDNAHLTGPFPSELGQLSNLLWLWLFGNHLTGTLPSEMGLMETADLVAIDFNPFEGPIPTEVGLMTNMWTFHIEESFITGTIPTEFALCTNLQSLVFPRTLLSGTIPTELGLMNLGRRLWGWETLLTGTLPTELGLLTRTATMDFSKNHLTGTLPSEIGNMANVWRVHLRENQLTGTLPTEVGQMQDLETLHLNQNQLTGQIPSELGALDNTVGLWDESSNSTVLYWTLLELQLDNNNFSGSLPSTLGLLKDLVILSIHNNSDLTGMIPSSFCNASMEEETSLVVSVDCALVECNCTVCSCA